ncbi:HIT domain-containing protein [Aquisalimonas sp.]|uniref:HIT family protein n=1 Tax=Aquisalimonas sp. TaxID=1872621 RepID=UPI0025BF1582|nr:HIT domain-containing protein [Aquisalimonas sp.]
MAILQIHAQLQADCHDLGRIASCQVLLHTNPGVPWYIVVPETAALELHELTLRERLEVDRITDSLARFIKHHHRSQRINVAAIGNRVPQLHIHVVGRSPGDPCWPDVVWGNLPPAAARCMSELRAIQTALDGALADESERCDHS